MIGIYDSGVGGLTIAHAIREHIPGIDICYYADTAQCPLGEKPVEIIVQAVKEGVITLFGQGCELVVLACNTATAVALSYLQHTWLPSLNGSKKILGIIRPVPELLHEEKINTNRRILVLATPATISSGYYDKELSLFGYNNISLVSCPGLAYAIETDDQNGVDTALESALRTRVNTISMLDVAILACTHYPLVRQQILTQLTRYGAPQNVKLVDQSDAVARKLLDYVNRKSIPISQRSIFRCIVSGNDLDFGHSLSRFHLNLGFDLITP